MLLSSVNRLLLYTGLEESVESKRDLSIFLNSISTLIENECNRSFELKRRTEYFDYETGNNEFFPLAYPITNIVSVHTDITGLYTGSEVAELNYFIGQYNKTVCLWRNLSGNYKKGLRIIYDGGVATHPVNSIYTLTNTGSSDPEIDDYVTSTSYAGMGKVISYDNATKNIKIESLFGAFRIGDDLQFAQKEGGDPQDSKTGTISAIVSQSLVEQLPSVDQAIQLEVNYFQKNKMRLETTGTNKDGSSTRRTIDSRYMPVIALQPETVLFLRNEIRVEL